jgi:hypothetical protein
VLVVISSAVRIVRGINPVLFLFAEIVGDEINHKAAHNYSGHDVEASEVGKFTSYEVAYLFRNTGRAHLYGAQKHQRGSGKCFVKYCFHGSWFLIFLVRVPIF